MTGAGRRKAPRGLTARESPKKQALGRPDRLDRRGISGFVRMWPQTNGWAQYGSGPFVLLSETIKYKTPTG